MNHAAMKNSGRLAQVDFDYGQSRIAARLRRDPRMDAPTVSGFPRQCVNRVEQARSRAQGLMCDSMVHVSCDPDLEVWPATGAICHRFRQLPVGESFLRRPHAQGTVGTFCVVPVRKRIKTALNYPPFTGGAGYGSCRSPNGFSYDVELHAYK